MARNHRSARQAGTRFERLIADYLALHIDDRIDRRVKTGANTGSRFRGMATTHGRIRSAPGSAGHTHRGLTHSLDLGKEGLAMDATRTCAHCGDAMPADTTGRGGRQPRRKFCTTKCKDDHRNEARRRPREVVCPSCGESRTLITENYAGGACRPCAAGVASEAARQANTRNPLDRFLDLVDRDETDGCWFWTGHLQPNGYGAFYLAGRTLRAHRWSYEHFVAPIPPGLQIDHLCRVRHCVNPQHLEPVSPAENTRRALEARA